MSTRLLVPVTKRPVLSTVEAFIESRGFTVLGMTAVRNYLENGPHLIIRLAEDLTANQITNATAVIQNHVNNQQAPSPATFIKLVAPNGTVWRVGVDNNGDLRTQQVT